MKKMMKNLKSNEGFTLVELMIVLSIIAILAVVLVPKVGDMKDSVRNQGVTANVNSVRAYLELEINNREPLYSAEGNRIIPLLREHFSTGNEIANPFTNGITIGAYTNTTVASTAYSVLVHEYNATVSTTMATAYVTGTQANYKGKVNVWCCTDGYVVWGNGSDGLPVAAFTVK